MILPLYKRISSWITVVFVVSVLALAPFSPTFHYERAHAGGPVGGATEATQLLNNAELIVLNGTAAVSAAANSVTAWATNLLGLKEFALDGFAWYAINLILEEMIRSITAWVNAGFPAGGPAFVRDLGGFLLNIADGIVGDFILNNTNLGFMCSPFQLDIQFALSSQYLFGRDVSTNSYQPQCRVTDILRNVQNFAINTDINGNVNIDSTYSQSFAAGGWAWWMAATQSQNNNVFGAYASAQNALGVALRNAKGEEIKLLEFGQGFLSRKECDANGKNCQIITPGQVIESQLNKALAGGQERLTVADEINELIAALFAQLVKQVLGGIGLFNTSFQPFTDPSSGTTYNSYLDAMANSTDMVGYGFGGGYAGGAAISEAQTYIALQDQIITAINNEENYLNTARNAYPGQISISSLPQALIDARRDARQEKQRVNGIISQIQTLQNSLTTTMDPAQTQNVINQINTVAAQLPTVQDTAQASSDFRANVLPVIQSFRNTVDADIIAAGGTPGSNSGSGSGSGGSSSGAPTVNLSAIPNPMLRGATTTVSWTVSNATSCTASGGNLTSQWSGSVSVSGGSIVYGPVNVAQTTLQIRCSNASGTSTDSVTLATS